MITFLIAFLLPVLANKIGRKATHAISLTLGGLGLISYYFISDPMYLLVSMTGVGIAWASILSMPYAILAGALPADKTGVYMGFFNFTIAAPQIVSCLVSGWILNHVFDNHAVYIIMLAGGSMILGALSVYFVEDDE